MLGGMIVSAMLGAIQSYALWKQRSMRLRSNRAIDRKRKRKRDRL